MGCFFLVVIIVLGAAYWFFIHDGGLGKLITRNPLPPGQVIEIIGLENPEGQLLASQVGRLQKIL